MKRRSHFGNRKSSASRKPQPCAPPAGLSAQQRAAPVGWTGQLPSSRIRPTARQKGRFHCSLFRPYVASVWVVTLVADFSVYV